MEPKVTILGLGYVGLTAALTFARAGIPVYGYEIVRGKVESIKRGEVPFHEPGLPELLRQCISDRTFSVGSELKASEVFFLTVGTPSREDGSIDLAYVKHASSELGTVLSDRDGYHLVVVKSTVIPGTSEKIVKPIVESKSGKHFGEEIGLTMNPEFLKEGSALKDMLEPDRVVIGEFDKQSGDMLSSLYAKVYGVRMPPLLRTNLVNAEFIKYASNAFLTTKISFINTIANIAQNVEGADVQVIAEGMGFDKRIGEGFLRAGLGYGGSCFPKDVRALIAMSKELDYFPNLLIEVEETNNTQYCNAVELAHKALGSLAGKTVTLLGLSFKPNTDDIREAVSIRIIRKLLEEKAKIQTYDPIAMANVAKEFGNSLIYANSMFEAIENSDCCIIVTEWDEFRKLEPQDFLLRMRTPVVIDGRRIYDKEKFSRQLRYEAIGFGMGPSRK